jgi:hypothetical protein
MAEWIKKVLSSSEDASYGRILSGMSFISLILLHILVMYNPWLLLKNTSFVPLLTDKLFYLASLAYGFTKISDISKTIFAHIDNKDGSKDEQ